jgi:hypothetical protein
LNPLILLLIQNQHHTRGMNVEGPATLPIPSESPCVDPKKERAAPDENAIVARVWDYYLAVTGRDPVTNTLTEGRRKLGKARLRSCLVRTIGDHDKAEQLLKLAIDAIGRDDWAMGRNPKTHGKSYCDWERHVF